MLKLLKNAQAALGNAQRYSLALVNRVVTPEERAEIATNIRKWASSHPKLAGFLAIQIACTGLPFLLLAVFTLATFVFALISAFVVALFIAAFISLVSVGFALILFIPAVLFTTFVACFFFLCGLVGYYTIQRFSNNKVSSTAATQKSAGRIAEPRNDSNLATGGSNHSTKNTLQAKGQRSPVKETPSKHFENVQGLPEAYDPRTATMPGELWEKDSQLLGVTTL